MERTYSIAGKKPEELEKSCSLSAFWTTNPPGIDMIATEI